MKVLAATTLLLFLTGCAAPKPAPSAIKQKLQRVAPKRSTLSVTYVTLPWTNAIPWQYPTNASNYCWRLQASSNAVDWMDVPGACVTDPMGTYATNGQSFFRLKGQLP